jgi:hypothetical protein
LEAVSVEFIFNMIRFNIFAGESDADLKQVLVALSSVPVAYPPIASDVCNALNKRNFASLRAIAERFRIKDLSAQFGRQGYTAYYRPDIDAVMDIYFSCTDRVKALNRLRQLLFFTTNEPANYSRFIERVRDDACDPPTAAWGAFRV